MFIVTEVKGFYISFLISVEPGKASCSNNGLDGNLWHLCILCKINIPEFEIYLMRSVLGTFCFLSANFFLQTKHQIVYCC